MSETVKIALQMMLDDALAGKDWPEVIESQRLNPHEDADGDDFCVVMYTQWIYSNLARLILAGDDVALAAFIERVDPRRQVRGEFEQQPHAEPAR